MAKNKTTFVFNGGRGASQTQIDELKEYVDETIEGAGAVRGKPCQIQSITDITGGHRVVFLWEDNSGTSHTSSLDVMDGTSGTDGEDAPSITAVTLMSDNSLRITLSDGTHYDTTPIPTVKGDDGEKGEDGFSPRITVKESTDSNYILHIKTADDEFDTVNLKGSGGSGTGDVSGVKGDVESAYRKGDVNIRLTDVANIGENLTFNAATKTLSADAQAIEVDSVLDPASENPVQNKVITETLDSKQDLMQFAVMPEASGYPQKIVQFTGTSTSTYTQGLFYRSTPKVVSGSLTYEWVQTDTQPSNRNYNDLDNLPVINGITVQGEKASGDLGLQGQIQFDVLPTANASSVGKIIQYTGASTADSRNGYFYQCRYDSETTSYKWVQVDVSSNAALENAIQTLQTNQGNMAALEITGVSNIVAALNALNAKKLSSITYTEPNLIIHYADDTTYQFNVRDAILRETQIGELADVNDSQIADTNVLQFDSATNAYKPYDIVAALTALLDSSKDYTDQQIGLAVQDDAFICDSKPTCALDSSTGKYNVIYYQNSVAHTTTDTTARFYYKVDGDPFCSSWFVTGDPTVDPVEFTYLISSPNFDDYVNKNTDLVSTYTEDMVDKSKVPTVAAMDALLAIVKLALADKVNTSDIEDSLTSQSATKVLSAKQGYLLKQDVDAKNEKMQFATLPSASASLAGVVYQFVGTTAGNFTKGKFYQCKYDNNSDLWFWEEVKYAADTDSALDPVSNNPVANSVIKAALDDKQDITLSAPVVVDGTSKTTVEDTLSALNTYADKKAEQYATLPTASVDLLNKIVQYTGSTTATYTNGHFYKCIQTPESDPATYEWSAVAVQDTVSVDNSTIVKDASTGEISAVTATSSTLGVVKGGDGTAIGAGGEVNVTDRLTEINALPAASAENLRKIYLLTQAQTGYTKGGIYECQEVAGSDPTEYAWVLISTNSLEAGKGITIEDDVISADTNIFPGTLDEWNALTEAEQTKYDFVASPDEASTTNVVNRGNINIEYNTLAVEVSQTVTFSQAMPNTDYVINIEPLGVNTSWRISNKTVNGFTMTGIKNSGSTGIVQYKYTAFMVD